MTAPVWITLALLVAMFVMLVWNKLPIWLVFVGALTVAMTLDGGPGGYRFADYARVGIPLTLIVSVVALVVLAPLVFGF